LGEDRREKWRLSPRRDPELTAHAAIVATLVAATEEVPPLMLFLVVLVIALGWAGWFWSWGRDRFVSNSGLGLPPDPFMARAPSAFAPPRTPAMARRHRREVLGALGLCALLTVMLARTWSPMWSLHVMTDLALVVYAWAVYSLERPRLGNEPGPVARRRLQPVLDGVGPRHQPGPRTGR
jgi:hypothetical protein